MSSLHSAGLFSSQSILLRDYMREISGTDRLPPDDLRPVLLGLFGEVGSILATAKKLDREKAAYTGFHDTVEEEFGDALWYFTTLCRRLGFGVDQIFCDVIKGQRYSESVAASDFLDGPVARVSSATIVPPLHEVFLKLGEAVAPILAIEGPSPDAYSLLCAFIDRYLQALQVSRVSFSKIVRNNLVKTKGRFIDPDFSLLPTFDGDYSEEERLPTNFEIRITQRRSGRSHLQWNGVFIGAPLTDNIRDPDGYRFHDVFHFAHAAILHWSPTFRALIQQKRKSTPLIDEAEDGGRAIVVEEGLTAWIFSRAKDLNYFRDQTSISFDLLKTVGQFVRGYEVAECPLALWERAILQGYEVFGHVRAGNGGIVIGDRLARTVKFKPLREPKNEG